MITKKVCFFYGDDEDLENIPRMMEFIVSIVRNEGKTGRVARVEVREALPEEYEGTEYDLEEAEND